MDVAVEPFKILQEQINWLIEGTIALLPNLLAGIVIIAVTWGIAYTAKRSVHRALSRTRPSLQRAVAILTKIAVWIVGISVAAMVVFPNLTPTKLIAGLGVGSIAVGLAFKDIFENFLAGFLILLRKPMRIGDDIECEGISGRVEEITIRDTLIRKRSGELILVPNSYLFKNPTTVLTDKEKRRISVVVGVAYDEDVAASRDVIHAAVEGLDSVDAEKDVEVFAREFNSSSVDFLVRWWTGSTPGDEHRSRAEVVTAIKAALDEVGIEIPFPYRTLTFKEPLEITKNASEAAA